MSAGNLREEDFDPTTQSGHRLSDGAAAAMSAALRRFELPHLGLLPNLELSTGAYVALGLLGVAVVGTPFIALYVLGRGVRAAGEAAAAAAPTVAKVGPALLPLVPEAAPIVAAASLYAGAPQSPASPPAPTASAPASATSVPADMARLATDAAALLRALGVMPGPAAPPAAPQALAKAVEIVARGSLRVPSVSVPSPPSSSAAATRTSTRR